MASLDLHEYLSDYTNIFLTLLAFISSALLYLSHKRKPLKKPIKIPPGPPGWPIVGNLLQYARSGKIFIHYVRDLTPIYGPIFTLKMGSRTLIIVTSADLAHDALISQGQTFANRPEENPTRSIFSCNKFTVNSLEHGPMWRSLRRNLVSNMLNSTRVREFQGLRRAAMDRFIERLRDEAESNPDRSVWVLKNVRFAVFSILLSMCFGIDMDEDEIVNVDNVMKKVLVALTPRLDDFLPLLKPFFTKQRKKALEVRREQIEVLLRFIERRRSELKNNESGNTQTPSFSYLDTLFDLKIEGRKSSPSDVELVTLCSEFLNGGTDTTATAIEWAILHLIESPEIQSKLYQDITTVTGRQTVDERDLDRMPYLNAFVKELLRKHPPTYFLLTHATTQPAKLGGYDVPTDANVEFFLPSIAEDPKLWSDPERFDPDRFLSGREEADITGVTQVKMMPFGVGRRICPGLGVGSLHITLMLARMVQEFEWSACPPYHRSIDKTEKLEFTVMMKTSLKASIRARTAAAS